MNLSSNPRRRGGAEVVLYEARLRPPLWSAEYKYNDWLLRKQRTRQIPKLQFSIWNKPTNNNRLLYMNMEVKVVI